MKQLVQILLFGLFSTPLFSQTKIFIGSPSPYIIFQRNQQHEGLIRINGYVTFPYSQLEARLVPLSQGVPAAWTPLESRLGQGLFQGVLPASGGWYQLQIRGIRAKGQVDTASIGPVGVGEVFLVAGHSNTMGLPRLGSKDGSGQVVSFNAINKVLNPENITVAPDAPMPVPAFEPLKAENSIFPSGESAWYWGELGSRLAQRLGVPVLFMNAGWAAANSINWREAAEGKNTRNIYVGKDWPNRQPYSNLINTLRYYHSWLGIRAVLWFHGENDAAHLQISQADYAANIRRLIELTRRDFGHSLPWVLALCSVSLNNPAPYLPVLNAQIELASDPALTTWQGPYTDTIQVPRPEHGHFENQPGGTQGISQVASAWNRALSDSYFTQRPAYAPATALFTGLVPQAVSPGQAFLLPFSLSAPLPDSTRYEAQLLDAQGNFITTVGSGAGSPLRVLLPSGLPVARYRLRVVAQNPLLAGTASESFRMEPGLVRPQSIHSLEIDRGQTEATVHALVTANEDHSRLYLERSADRTVFQPIAMLPVSSQNRSTSVLYSFTDTQPSSQTAYYRLRLETGLGTTYYSQLLADFRGDVPPPRMAFPNPASSREPIWVRTDLSETTSCQLFDSRGVRIPATLSASDVIGLSVVQPAHALSPGTYILQITQGATMQQQRIVIH